MTVKVMTTQRLKFTNGGRTWESKGRSIVEDAPDFIKNDRFFGMNLHNGRLVEFGAAPPPAEPTVKDSLTVEVKAKVVVETTAKPENKTTSREIIALSAKDATALIAGLEDLSVLRNAKELEAEKTNARKTVLEALDKRIDALEKAILTHDV